MQALENAETFWPGYVEGILRIALTLMGKYPNQTQRKGHAKSNDFYELQQMRSLTYSQRPRQKKAALYHAFHMRGLKGLPPYWHELGMEFERANGRHPKDDKEFMDWFQVAYPQAYLELF